MSKEVKFKEVFVSIVTVPKLNQLEIGSEVFTRFKSTYIEHREYINDRQVVQSYYDDAGKSLGFCKVFQIAIGYVVKDTVRVKVLIGEEGSVIKTFHNIIRDNFPDAKLYAYNPEFVYDVVKFRGRAHRIGEVHESPQFRDIEKRPWNRKLSVSLIDEVSSSNRNKISLINALHGAELEYSGINTLEDLNVSYRAGKIDEINSSGAYTIKGLVDLKSFFDVSDYVASLDFSVETINDVEDKEVNVLEHLIASGELTSDVLMAIVDRTNKEKLDRDSVYDLTVAALSKNKDFQSVDVSVKEEIREALGLKSLAQIKEDEKQKVIEENLLRYPKIRPVVNKGNLGKTEAMSLFKTYKDSPEAEKLEVVSSVEAYLKEYEKLTQQRAAKALILLKEKLNVTDGDKS